jgi:hypothetical protein
MADCGYLPRDIDELTFRDVERLHKYWNRHPPASWILAAVHGIKPADEKKKSSYDPAMQASPAHQEMIARNREFMKKHGIRIT